MTGLFIGMTILKYSFRNGKMWLAFALFVKQAQPQICPLGQTLMLSLHQEGIPPHLDIQRGQALTDQMEFSPMPIFQHLGARFLGMLTLMRMRHGVTDPQVARVKHCH